MNNVILLVAHPTRGTSGSVLNFDLHQNVEHIRTGKAREFVNFVQYKDGGFFEDRVGRLYKKLNNNAGTNSLSVDRETKIPTRISWTWSTPIYPCQGIRGIKKLPPTVGEYEIGKFFRSTEGQLYKKLNNESGDNCLRINEPTKIPVRSTWSFNIPITPCAGIRGVKPLPKTNREIVADYFAPMMKDITKRSKKHSVSYVYHVEDGERVECCESRFNDVKWGCKLRCPDKSQFYKSVTEKEAEDYLAILRSSMFGPVIEEGFSYNNPVIHLPDDGSLTRGERLVRVELCRTMWHYPDLIRAVVELYNQGWDEVTSLYLGAVCCEGISSTFYILNSGCVAEDIVGQIKALDWVRYKGISGQIANNRNLNSKESFGDIGGFFKFAGATKRA